MGYIRCFRGGRKVAIASYLLADYNDDDDNKFGHDSLIKDDEVGYQRIP